MPRSVTVLAFFLFQNPIFCQFNDSLNHHFRYGISGMINKTAAGQQDVLHNVVSFGVKKRKVALNVDASWIYGIQNGKLVNNDLTSGMNLDLLKDVHRLYYWGLAAYNTSYSLRVLYQFQAGAGVGYNILKKNHAEIIVSDGIVVEAGDLKPVSGSSDVYRILRNSLRIKYSWKINDLVTLEGVHFWQPAFGSLDDYIIRSISAFSLKVKAWVSISVGLTYNKVSRTDRENLLFNFGLIADRYY